MHCVLTWKCRAFQGHPHRYTLDAAVLTRPAADTVAAVGLDGSIKFDGPWNFSKSLIWAAQTVVKLRIRRGEVMLLSSYSIESMTWLNPCFLI